MATALQDKPRTVVGEPDRSLDHVGGRYLTFELAGEEYGIDVLRIREIIGAMDVTAVACGAGSL